MFDSNILHTILGRDHELDRYRPILCMIESALFGIACLFWIDANTSAVGYSEETWGSFAYQFKAEFWAFIMMAGSAFSLIGLIRPIMRNMVTFGAVIQTVQFSLLSYSAAFTGGEFAIAIYASVLFVPLHFWLAIEGLHRDPIGK